MPRAESLPKARGTVFIRTQICKGCAYCIDFCPFHCLELARDFNARGYHYPVLVKPEECSGCNLCGLYCPDFAIFAARHEDLQKLKQPTVP